jgi:hypothetical protein
LGEKKIICHRCGRDFGRLRRGHQRRGLLDGANCENLDTVDASVHVLAVGWLRRCHRFSNTVETSALLQSIVGASNWVLMTLRNNGRGHIEPILSLRMWLLLHRLTGVWIHAVVLRFLMGQCSMRWHSINGSLLSISVAVLAVRVLFLRAGWEARARECSSSRHQLGIRSVLVVAARA